MIYTLILFLYNVLFTLMLPFLIIKKLIRSRRNKGYRKRLLERFGHTPFKFQNSIWIHSVSVGESIGVAPLVKRLAQNHPKQTILVTTSTPTGSQQVKKIYAGFNNIQHCYMPYDLTYTLYYFIQRVKPKICVIMETEIWPSLLAVCKNKNIPIVLTNARLSQKSAKSYAYSGLIGQTMLNQLSHISAQTTQDAKRFQKLGVPSKKMIVTGNLKYDFIIEASLKSAAKDFGGSLNHSFVWVAASTHQGEYEIILNAHKTLLKRNPNALLILIPRHPEYFDHVANLLENEQLSYARRTDRRENLKGLQVYLADTMGEALLFYAASDVAFVGGSFSNTGGHNMLEPAALSKPILSGPSTFNFSAISKTLIKHGALKITKTQQELEESLLTFANDDTQIKLMGDAALKCFQSNKGATDKQLQQIESYL